jgi:hypothetical protein
VELTEYLVTLQEIGLEVTSLARKRVALKQFYAYVEENDIPMKADFDLVPKSKLVSICRMSWMWGYENASRQPFHGQHSKFS